MATDHAYRRTLAVSWDQLHRDSRTLARHVMDLGVPAGVVALARGGLIPAAIVARELDVRRVDALCVASYDGRSQGEAALLNALDPAVLARGGADWLVVDDLADTGATARLVRGLLPQARFAAVYVKPKGRPLVDVFVAETGQDVWILFPWDAEPQFVPPLAALRSPSSQ